MDDAEWPEQSIPEPVKKLLARLYKLFDSNTPTSGRKLAINVFTKDGELVLNKRRMKGTERNDSRSLG